MSGCEIIHFYREELDSFEPPVDYFAVLLVSLFLATAALWLINPAAQVYFYVISAVMLVYAPFSKICHCIYFAYARLFFGKFVGSRAVLPHNQQQVM